MFPLDDSTWFPIIQTSIYGKYVLVQAVCRYFFIIGSHCFTVFEQQRAEEGWGMLYA